MNDRWENLLAHIFHKWKILSDSSVFIIPLLVESPKDFLFEHVETSFPDNDTIGSDRTQPCDRKGIGMRSNKEAMFSWGKGTRTLASTL